MSKESIKITKEGLKKLLAKKEKLFKELKKIQGKKGEAAEIGGNAWHDNFSFEELERQERMLNKRIADISDIINRAELVEPPLNNEFLQIGHIAILEFNDGSEKKFEIVGFGETDLEASPPKIEYLAPLVRNLLGAEIGTTVKANIGGKMKNITLVNILRKG